MVRIIDLDPNLNRSNEWKQSYQILARYTYQEGYGNGPQIMVHISIPLTPDDSIALKDLGWNIRGLKMWKMIEYW